MEYHMPLLHRKCMSEFLVCNVICNLHIFEPVDDLKNRCNFPKAKTEVIRSEV